MNVSVIKALRQHFLNCGPVVVSVNDNEPAVCMNNTYDVVYESPCLVTPHPVNIYDYLNASGFRLDDAEPTDVFL